MLSYFKLTMQSLSKELLSSLVKRARIMDASFWYTFTSTLPAGFMLCCFELQNHENFDLAHVMNFNGYEIVGSVALLLKSLS